MSADRNRESGTGERAHLGVGWAFPVRPVAGRLCYVRHEEDIEQAIAMILETARPERVMLPGFGAGLRNRVFDPSTPTTWRAIEDEVTRALRDFEPRIDVEAVRARSAPDRPALILIEIDYVVRATNAAFNLVYPFYLREGA